jgi:hypothetical protein
MAGVRPSQDEGRQDEFRGVRGQHRGDHLKNVSTLGIQPIPRQRIR